ncbi:DNA-binding protein [Ochrobactrum sp. MH181795]|uniref:DNA binding, excisionase family domain protein n=2 Tax=Brucella lupini TaxID=255457 RepID=A0A256GWV3_9HYPH|nr:helix-turn-helix domain-containing protein [Brucella anthropi]KAB2704023.1 helix-turn-helix domain-containing protein [Brucella lupini]RNL43504.1 DNA-binding protein [Ochrobactrum sp. MH181795]KAB2728789.1 helix-turn-helix domain-containing protein [Brucella anthropi]KAB2745961.1 helix-turn-helix domain-containing protein [Brucella anthropi]KAB2800720.1 helix-turn-helix domain-containing protein [Brucella anthropi]
MQCQLLSPKQLADRSGWPVARIRNLIAKQEIRHVRIGGSLFLPEDAVDEYLAENMVEPKQNALVLADNASRT